MLQDYDEKSKLLLMGGKDDKFKMESKIPERIKVEKNDSEGNAYDGLFNK